MNIQADITTIILDDENDAIKNLQNVIKKYCPEIKILKTCNTIEDAYRFINEYKPQLVFLDIDLGDNKTSFDLLSLFNPVFFKIIFVTAYHDFALKAIKFSALDYILKPFAQTEVLQAIEKVKKNVFTTESLDLLHTQIKKNKLSDKIALNLGNSIEIIDINDIINIEASKNYSIVTTIKKEKLLASKLLGEFEELLKDKGFYRIHYSHLINIAHIKNYSSSQGGVVIMNNNIELPISDRKKKSFFSKMDELLKIR